MAAAADKVRQATVAVETGVVCGKAAGVGIASPRTALGTTIDHPDRAGRVNGRTVGDTSVDSPGLDNVERMGTQNE